jgi:hypothetical protein
MQRPVTIPDSCALLTEMCQSPTVLHPVVAEHAGAEEQLRVCGAAMMLCCQQLTQHTQGGAAPRAQGVHAYLIARKASRPQYEVEPLMDGSIRIVTQFV